MHMFLFQQHGLKFSCPRDGAPTLHLRGLEANPLGTPPSDLHQVVSDDGIRLVPVEQ